MNNSSWSTQTFGVFAEFKNGLNYNSEAVGNGLKIIGVADFKSRRTLDYKYLAQVSGFDNINDGYLLKNHDLVFVRSNGNKALIGRVLFINNLKEKLTFSGFTIRARVKDESWFPEYVSYIFGSEIARSQYYKLGSGTNISNLSQEILDVIEVPKPSLKEQHKITDILNLWENSISRVELLVFEKNEIRKGLMQQLLSGKRRFPEFGKPRKDDERVPKDWALPKTEEVFKNCSTKNHPKEIVLSVTQDQGVVPRNELARRINADKSNTSTYKLVQSGDFVISLRSFQGGLEYSNYRGLVSPAYHVIRPKIEVSHDYYRHYFKSPEFIKRLAVAVIGIRDGKQVSYGDFSFMRIPVPGLEEQNKIAETLNKADEEITLLQKQLEALKLQKKGLMQQLLTGKKRVKVKDVA